MFIEEGSMSTLSALLIAALCIVAGVAIYLGYLLWQADARA